MSNNVLNEPVQDIPYRDLKPSSGLISNYGILFMLWGWAGVLGYALGYIEKYAYISISIRESIHIFRYMVIVLWLAATLYFLYRHSSRKLTYFGLVLRYVWVSMILSMAIVNWTQMNVLHEVNFELQHPVFMVFYAFATVVSGSILKQKLLVLGGILLAIGAIVCSFLELQQQLMVEAIAWIMAFIIPGHIMYAKGQNEEAIHLYQ